MAITEAVKAKKRQEEETWLLLVQAKLATQSEIARRVGLSRQRVHQRLTRAQWAAERSPGRLDALRRSMGLTLTGSSIEIQTRQCGHLSLEGIECLVCSRGAADARIGRGLADPKKAPIPSSGTTRKKSPAQIEKALDRAAARAAKAEVVRTKAARKSNNSTRRRRRSRG